MEQTINIKGFLAGINIKPDEYLLPLQEAIVNSIQSIEDKTSNGDEISIKIIRDKQLTLNENIDTSYKPILGFEIFDNGVGFIKKRFNAFNIAFTDLNKGKGCKGVGRYTILACFNNLEISSIFLEGKKWKSRSFKFDSNGVNAEEEEGNLRDSSVQQYETIVKLNNYKPNFQNYINKNRIEIKDIVEGIVEHCLLYFISNEIPTIKIYNENDEKNAVIINDLYTEFIKFDSDVKDVKLNNVKSPFHLNYIRNYTNRTHSVHLCANKRKVGNKINISNYIPSFVKPLCDKDDEKYYLSIYLTGDYLDEKANNQRNKFSIPERSDEKSSFDDVSIEELLNNVSENVRSQYNDEIQNAIIEKNKKIHDYILNPNKPRLQYKHLLNVAGIFNDIPANATEERLEAELHKKVFKLEQKRSKAFEKAFASKKYDKDEFSEIIKSVLNEEAAFSHGKLADLMIRRKAVLKLFRKYLEWRNDENYMLEEDLHNIIFTMGAESDLMPREYHNLWLLDERLTFNSKVTSNKQLRTDSQIDSDSQQAPDLLIYDFPWAYSDNLNDINSLVVFEFKRPGRDMNNKADKKLDTQVEEYFEKLMESRAKSDKGKFLNIENNTPKFGYVICDLHKDLIEYNVTHNYFKKTPHNTLYKINSELNQYIEVMSFETMIDFAEKRHDAFFQALGIDNL